MKPLPFPTNLPPTSMSNGNGHAGGHIRHNNGGGKSAFNPTNKARSSSQHLPSAGGANGNGHHYSNGSTRGGGGGECRCCPYGYHIDLGFVKFAEDVVAGKEQAQSWADPASLKRSRRGVASPMRSLSSPTTDGEGDEESSGHGSSSAFHPIQLHSNGAVDTSTTLDASLISTSTTLDHNGGGIGLGRGSEVNVSELDDILQMTPTMPSHHPPPAVKTGAFKPVSILKNRSDSSVIRAMPPDGGHRSRVDGVSEAVVRASVLEPASARHYGRQSVEARRYRGALSVPEESFTTQPSHRHRLEEFEAHQQSPLPVRTSTPSKSSGKQGMEEWKNCGGVTAPSLFSHGVIPHDAVTHFRALPHQTTAQSPTSPPPLAISITHASTTQGLRHRSLCSQLPHPRLPHRHCSVDVEAEVHAGRAEAGLPASEASQRAPSPFDE